MKRWIGISLFMLLLAFWVTPWAVLGQAAHSILVGWTYTQGTDAAVGFNVYRGTVSGGPYTKQNATPLTVTTLSYTDLSGTAGTKYFYVIRALDAIGLESPNSPEASATMLGNPLAPLGVTAVAQ